MATIYTGIYQKLKSSQTPWADKLKLARFALVSRQCLLPNKEQVLLDWTTNALSAYYNKKAEVPFKEVEGLWSYLDEFLHSQRIKHVLSKGKTITVNPAVCQIIIERIQEASSGTLSVSLSTVLSCCQGIVSSPVLSVSYTARCDVLVQLLVKVCGLACYQLSQQEECSEPLSLNVFEVLFLVLNSYLTVQKQQGNSNRVFTQVTEHLLQPLCLLRHLLSSRTWTERDDPRIRQNLNKEIRSKVDMILQSALFFDDRLPCYKKEVLPPERESSSKKGSTGNILLCPVATILSKLVHGHGVEKEALLYAVRCNSLPLLFKFALDSFGKDDDNKLVCFHIMTKFILALEFTDDLQIKETFNPEHWNIVLLSLENMLNSCLAGDIYNVAADRIHHGEVQLTFYRKVAQLLFSNAQTDKPSWYRCLKTLLALNHLILEPDLDELVSSAWVDAENTELRVKKARETLVSEVIRTYAKLRQLPRLTEEVLIVITRPAADELRPELLTEAVQKTLSQCLLDSPASQNLEICRRILEKIQSELTYVKEMRKESALKLLSLSVLLHTVVFSLKTVDDSTPVPLVRQTQSMMEQMFRLVGSLLECLEGLVSTDTLWIDKIQEVSLLLTYIWHEADSLFQNHCSKYTSPAGTSTVRPVSDTVEKVLALKVSSSPLSRLLQKLLAVHRIKKHLLVSPLPVLNTDNKRHTILCESAQFVVNRQDSLINLSTDQTWDLQLCNVNNDTYSVACWFLVTTNLPLIAPYLSKEDACHIADAMLNSLLHSDLGSNSENDDMSVFLISKQLLESAVLCELPGLYSALVKSVTSRFFSHVQSQCPSFSKSVQTDLSVESLAKGEHIPEVSLSMKRLKTIAEEIIKSIQSGVSVPVSPTQVESLLQLIKIASVLDPHAMSPEDYSELFLSALVLNLCAQSDENGVQSAPLNLLNELFRFMTGLLMGQNSHVFLKIVHGSALLEATMSSIFCCFSKGLFHTVDSTAWFPFLQSAQGFIQSLIQLVLSRKSSVRVTLEKFTNFLIERVAAGETMSKDLGEYEQALYVQLHLATLSTLCKEMIVVLGKNKQLDGTLLQLLEKIFFKMGPAIQDVLTGKATSVLRQSFCVDVVTVMIKSELAMASHQTLSEDISEGDGSARMSHMALYKSFGQQILKELCPAPRPFDFIFSSIHYLSAFYVAAETTKELDVKDLHFTILQCVHKLLSGILLSVSEVKELEEPIKDLLAQLMARCSQEQFHLVFLLLRDGLVASKIESGSHKETLATLTLIKLLACCPLPHTFSRKFWLTVPQILSSLVHVIRESSALPSLTSVLTVPAVETVTTLLRQGESQLSNPHHIILGLGGLHFVPLDSRSIDDYYSAFQSIHEVLYTLYLCYPLVMLKAAPTFLNCFYRLVTSIIHEGGQRTEKEKEKDSETLLKCAMLVERMYSHIGSTTEGFTDLASFIVAQYVGELQKVTLKPEIKAHLTEGIYRVLDLCSEKAIKFLNVTLHAGVKEVFNELYKNYTHYHKSKMHGEKRYAA
ncbi:unhealthy ribosome biogenesis protein 2 homolog [Astyanax mexicanus]|uniref:unhealthy ribosome biogenesis protein 2 homolog n=1 Tax=Astyanax mexicanus TaxID=7994 RepID=UPI0020CB2C02|nr:unhealthy ribosome biogenesis protein 2 homolog [Astyanax mexicanus]